MLDFHFPILHRVPLSAQVTHGSDLGIFHSIYLHSSKILNL